MSELSMPKIKVRLVQGRTTVLLTTNFALRIEMREAMYRPYMFLSPCCTASYMSVSTGHLCTSCQQEVPLHLPLAATRRTMASAAESWLNYFHEPLTATFILPLLLTKVQQLEQALDAQDFATNTLLEEATCVSLSGALA